MAELREWLDAASADALGLPRRTLAITGATPREGPRRVGSASSSEGVAVRISEQLAQTWTEQR